MLPLVVAALTVVRTPFGDAADGCTVKVPHGTHVEEGTDGLLLSHPTLGKWEHVSPAHCRLQSSAPVTCSSLPCNNWIDNAGWMQPNGTTPLGGFSATYTVPLTPPGRGTGQTLFYFIGAENTDGQPRHGQPPPSGRAILQPVLTYDPDGWCKTSSTGWCFASWYCCPKNLRVHSDYIQDVKPGDSFYSFFNITTDGGTFVVSGTSAATGKSTALTCPRQGRNFNWADATLEVYQITSCDMFSPAEMEFQHVSLWDTSYKPLLPEWALSPPSPCGGSIIVDPVMNGAIHVSHSGADAVEAAA